jgi:N-acetylated-alpha-linked acidic dipeptidase
MPAAPNRLAVPLRLCGALTACVLSTATLCVAAPEADSADMVGFSAAAADAEAQLERRFDADLSAASLRAWMEQMSSEPNHVGSAHDKANAEFQLQKFREWGWDASIETFSVLYPTPRTVSVELVAPTHFVARLTEPPIAGDRTSSKTRDELPAYNVYGADGDVTAELVYVNQGMPDDYAELERRGISVKGRIVLTRYGGGWRGLKPKVAYEHGAVGCLIYSTRATTATARAIPTPRAATGRATPCSAVRCRTSCCIAAIH